MVESEQVAENARIRVSIDKWENTGEYGEKVESVRVPTNCLDEYRKKVESLLVLKNGRIRASTMKRYNPCHQSKTGRTSFEKW